jgi:hypothetical protein
MADNPIGVTFIPSAQNAAMGPRQGAMEGPGGSDLAQAFKILSLHLPRVLGAQSLAPKRLLTSSGSGALPSGFNPQAAVIQALLQAMSGGGNVGPIATYPDAQPDTSRGLQDFFRNENPRTPPVTEPPPPKVTPGGEKGIADPVPWADASVSAPPSAPFGAPMRRDRLAY